jgi:NAD(P)H-hydrate epimerase
LVVARKIHSAGGNVTIYIVGDQESFRGVARRNLEIAEKLSLNIEPFEATERISMAIAHSDAVIDAIFGTGLSRDVDGRYRDCIEMINAQAKMIFSLDIPSGVNGDTGCIMGTAVEADCTITFGLPKIGNMLYPGYERCGKLYVTHISFPPALYDDDALLIAVNEPPPLPPRDSAGHKGDFGKALFIAGAASYFGAPYFAAYSFLKAGGGYARLAAPRSMVPFIANKGSEIVCIPQDETDGGSIAYANGDALVELSAMMDIVVLGPGVSLVQDTRSLVQSLTQRIDKPLIIDGDGITALCEDPILTIVKKRKGVTILTPHMGEMSRITGKGIDDIEKNPIAITQETARELGAIIVLKGAHTIIGYPDGRVRVNMSGNAGMATAGSGDVLTGTIAAMYGLGLSIEDAVGKGVFIHGLAGDLASCEEGEDGITAQNILDCLPRAVRMDREEPEATRDIYAIECL